MAKELMVRVKLQIPGGQATPAPPVGPSLGQHGVNIGEFVRRVNEATKSAQGMTVPVVISIYKDRSFDFIVKTSPASVLLKKAAGVAAGSGEPHKTKVGQVTREQVKEIAKIKLPDLNTTNLEKAVKIIEGTARNMGIEIK
ncbi:MAG: 50S ribosomal protein L11 [Planctomycetota bacterium]